MMNIQSFSDCLNYFLLQIDFSPDKPGVKSVCKMRPGKIQMRQADTFNRFCPIWSKQNAFFIHSYRTLNWLHGMSLFCFNKYMAKKSWTGDGASWEGLTRMWVSECFYFCPGNPPPFLLALLKSVCSPVKVWGYSWCLTEKSEQWFIAPWIHPSRRVLEF